MSESIKKETVLVIVMGMAVVVLIVVVFFWDRASAGTFGSEQQSPTQTIDSQEDDWAVYPIPESFVQPGGYSSSGGRVAAGASTGIDREKLTTLGLVGELKRIIRAGRKLETLRNSRNLTLTRRCLETSQELESNLASVRSWGLNIPFPAGTTSLEEVFQQAAICVSCSSEARTFCVMAETGLNMAGN